MKFRIFATIIILLAFVSIIVHATDYDYTISPGDAFTFAEYGDDLTSISQKLNTSAEELNSYFNHNGLIYLAVTDDAKTQIKISVFADNFSSAAGDISNLDDTAIVEFANAVGQDTADDVNIILNNDRKYICVKNTRKDSGGIYTVTQYITICDNKTFYFAGYNEGEDTSQEILAAFNSFKLFESQIDTDRYNKPLAFSIVGIAVFGIIAVIMVIGIIKLKRKPQKEAELFE